jgi:hypothetical protein
LIAEFDKNGLRVANQFLMKSTHSTWMKNVVSPVTRYCKPFLKKWQPSEACATTLFTNVIYNIVQQASVFFTATHLYPSLTFEWEAQGLIS